MASNNPEEAGDFEEPSVEQTPGAMLETVAEAGQNLAEVDLGATMPNGGPVASGKRASKLGSGGPGLGFGPGDGGVAREQRWSIIYNTGQDPEEYARQLDGLGVELAVVRGPGTTFIHFSFFRSDANQAIWHRDGPTTGCTSSGRGGDERRPTSALFKKAGVEIGDENVFQFYSADAERRLAELEVRYKGRNPGEIRVTRFQVVPKGESYDFEVVAQETLR